MNVLSGHERRIFHAFAEALIDRPVPSMELLARRADDLLSRCSGMVRLFFRFSLLLLDWGTLFLRTNSGRFERFSRLPGAARRRYLRLWMNHKISLLRQIFLLHKMVALASYYDDRAEGARLGYAPEWLC